MDSEEGPGGDAERCREDDPGDGDEAGAPVAWLCTEGPPQVLAGIDHGKALFVGERAETLARERGLLDSMRLTHHIDEDRRRVDRLLPTEVLDARAPDALVEDALEELRRLTPIDADGSDENALGARRFKVRAQLAAAPVRRLSVREAAEDTEVALLAARQGVLLSASRLWPAARGEHL